jgi:arylsulfatase A
VPNVCPGVGGRAEPEKAMTDRTKGTRRAYLAIAAFGAAVAAAGVRPARAGPPRSDPAGAGHAGLKPNFIVFFCDDLGYGDLGCYGSKTHRTPNLNRMAAEGMRFTDFYAAAPWCSPSRAALLTGRYPSRSGCAAGYWGEKGLDVREITIAQVLKRAGYATGCIGKWHLGIGKEYLPTARGFDAWFGLPWSNDKGRHRPLYRDGTVIEETPALEILTRRYTEEAIRFIAAHKDGPFFLYVPHTMPHLELAASDSFRGKSRGGLYGDVVEELDWSAGQILKSLADLRIDDRTLVVFSSDNGPVHVAPQCGSAGPFRGRKGSTWEGGMREPGIFRWPGKIPAGTTCSELATTMDLLPTFAALAGTPAPSDRPIDGKDIRPLLFGASGAKTSYDAFFYYAYHDTLEAVRAGKWKLRLAPAPKGRPPAHAGKAELYDLEADLGETKDVAAEHPDVAEQLRGRLERQRAEPRAGAG